MPDLYVHMLPQFLSGVSLHGATAVVIDVLRASSTIVHALANGAESVIPCLTVETALETAQQYPEHSRLLGGERHGTLIPGFDLGNSPRDYSLERVREKTLIFTTTNGTRALRECQAADQVAIGAFVNRQAVADFLAERQQDVHLVCAGTDGKLTAEDILFAGAIASELLSLEGSAWTAATVQTQMAADYYQARSASRNLFAQAFTSSPGAVNLIELGMTRDVQRCMEENLFDCVPCWDSRTEKITVSR